MCVVRIATYQLVILKSCDTNLELIASSTSVKGEMFIFLFFMSIIFILKSFNQNVSIFTIFYLFLCLNKYFSFSCTF